MAALSLSGLFMWAGIIVGAILGLKYMTWEMEHLPSKMVSAGISLPSGPAAYKKAQPYLGWILFILIFLMPVLYGKQVRFGILATLGLLAGFVMMRARFCFAATFRDPFMTGESDKTQSVILSVLIVVLGVGILKWVGSLHIAQLAEATGLRERVIIKSAGLVPWYRAVFANAGWGGIVGGIIFGFGMLLAGG